MSVTYLDVPDDVPALASLILSEFHPELAEANVTLGYLFAFNKKGAAIKLHGYPCQATIKVNSYKDRKQGKPDATIEIDGANWYDKTEDEKLAILDHEITHLIVVHDRKTGLMKVDDLGRPKLKLRLHDYQLGGFRAVAERHGQAAPEVQQVANWRDRFGQMLMEWGDERAPSKGKRRKADSGPELSVTSA